MQDFRNLEVWRLAHALTLEIYGATKPFPADERYGLTSQLRRAAASVEANLAEGCGRGSDADFARFTQVAMGSASEVECHLLIARDLGLLDNNLYTKLDGKQQQVKRMLAGLLKRLRT
ncbi:MAG: four helix bundle protein [Planctomycetota bacterium]